MAITWVQRHESDPGLLAYEGKFICGQIAMYDVADERHRRTGRSYWIGYLAGVPVTGRCFDADEACQRVQRVFVGSGWPSST